MLIAIVLLVSWNRGFFWKVNHKGNQLHEVLHLCVFCFHCRRIFGLKITLKSRHLEAECI